MADLVLVGFCSKKNRPSQLLLSPSDGALKASAIIDQRSPKRLEDRDVLSDVRLSPIPTLKLTAF